MVKPKVKLHALFQTLSSLKHANEQKLFKALSRNKLNGEVVQKMEHLKLSVASVNKKYEEWEGQVTVKKNAADALQRELEEGGSKENPGK